MLGVIGVSSIAGIAIGTGACYLWLKNSTKNRFSYIEKEAKAKAKAIEKETELLLKSAQVKIKEKELEQEREFQKRVAKVDERNRDLILQKKELTSKEDALHLLEQKVLDREKQLESLEKKKQD